MAQCPNCGAAVEGRFCAKCGTMMAAQPPQGAAPPPGPPGAYPPPPPGGSYTPPAAGYPGGQGQQYAPPPAGAYQQQQPGPGAPAAGYPGGQGSGYGAPGAGYQQPGYQQQQGYGYQQPPPPAQSMGMDENVAGALCYIPIVGIIFLLIEPYNRNRTIRFHAFQSIFYAIATIVTFIALSIFGAIVWNVLPYRLWWAWSLLMWVVQLAFFAIWVFLVVKAAQRSRLVLPVIGQFAEKQA